MTEREKRIPWFQAARFGTVPQYPCPLPDPIDTVLEIEYKLDRKNGFSGAEKQALAIKSVLCYDNRKYMKGDTVVHLQESGEMYLETIYILSKRSGAVRSLDVAEYMNFSKPSVSRAVGLLKSGGYILMDRDGFLTLTDAGMEVAEKIYERHTLLTSFLVRLGVDETVAAEDACKMEHVISDESFAAIKRHVNSAVK